MSLYSPGTLLDRATIIFRKIVEADWEDRPTEHWRQEYRDLWSQIPMPDPATWPLLLELFGVNMALWDCEDKVRKVSDLPTYEKITWLNDRRARLIQQINQLFDPQAAPEKLYGGVPHS